MDTPDLDRLTILERAQLLHDATLRRHGEMLDRHEDSRLQHEAQMARMEAQQATLNDLLIQITTRLTEEQGLQAEQLARYAASLAWHEEVMASLAQTLAVIKDMLDRGNGRP
jgi:hypothetical protein